LPRRGAETLCFARIETLLRRRRLSHHLTQRPSHRRRWCPQPGDKRQDFLEHLSRHRDLSHLEGNVAAMADPTFAPILISFSRSLVCDHGAAVFGVER